MTRATFLEVCRCANADRRMFLGMVCELCRWRHA